MKALNPQARTLTLAKNFRSAQIEGLARQCGTLPVN
jgi:hypothetical protein